MFRVTLQNTWNRHLFLASSLSIPNCIAPVHVHSLNQPRTFENSLFAQKTLSPSFSLFLFLPSFLPSFLLPLLSFLLFSREYCIHTVIHILPGTRSKQWKKKWPLSSQVTASCTHRSVRFFPSRFSFSSPSKDDEARPGAAPYFFTFHTSHPLWEVRKHGTASPGFFFPISNSLPPSLSLSLPRFFKNYPLLYH